MQRYANMVAVVTGAASGIGKATATRLASEGAAVACLDVQEEANEAVASSLDGATATTCNVRDLASIESAVAQVIDAHGRIDVLCNIAGLGHFTHDLDETPEGWERVLGVNLTGTFFMSQAALPHILESKGAIVNTASTAATKAQPWSAAYSASKGGVISLTQTMALNHAKSGVRINCIAPGGVETPITEQFIPPEGFDETLFARILPLMELGRPDQLAAAFAFLGSSDASYCNGIVLRVDGGMQA